MDRQDPPKRPSFQLTWGLIGLDNEKDAMMSHCLDRKKVRDAIWQMHRTGTVRPVETLDGFFCHLVGRSLPTGINNCPLAGVLTCKNFIYLLNLQFSFFHRCNFTGVVISVYVLHMCLFIFYRYECCYIWDHCGRDYHFGLDEDMFEGQDTNLLPPQKDSQNHRNANGLFVRILHCLVCIAI